MREHSYVRASGCPAKFHRERIAPGGVLYLKSGNAGLIRLIRTCWRLNISNSVLSSVGIKEKLIRHGGSLQNNRGAAKQSVGQGGIPYWIADESAPWSVCELTNFGGNSDKVIVGLESFHRRLLRKCWWLLSMRGLSTGRKKREGIQNRISHSSWQEKRTRKNRMVGMLSSKINESQLWARNQYFICTGQCKRCKE